MSKLNGDKSRFQVRRKATLLRRVRSRTLQAAISATAAPGAAAPTSSEAPAGSTPTSPGGGSTVDE